MGYLQILNNHKIKPDRKKPFVLFLLWVFINTGKNTTLTGSIQLTHSQYVNFMVNYAFFIAVMYCVERCGAI